MLATAVSDEEEQWQLRMRSRLQKQSFKSSCMSSDYASLPVLAFLALCRQPAHVIIQHAGRQSGHMCSGPGCVQSLSGLHRANMQRDYLYAHALTVISNISKVALLITGRGHIQADMVLSIVPPHAVSEHADRSFAQRFCSGQWQHLNF